MSINITDAIKPYYFFQFLNKNGKINRNKKTMHGKIKDVSMTPYNK